MWVSISINCSIKSITFKFELSIVIYLQAWLRIWTRDDWEQSRKWKKLDSNSGPPDCESDALTTQPRCHKLKCKEMIFLNKLWWPLQHLKYHDTSTILSTQGWINSIATSHSKMGSVLKVWTKPRWKRRQRGWNWHTFQPTSLPPTMVRIIILKTDTSRVIIKYRPTKTNPKYFLPENCHLNGPI